MGELSSRFVIASYHESLVVYMIDITDRHSEELLLKISGLCSGKKRVGLSIV